MTNPPTDPDDIADSIRAQRERQHEAWRCDWRNHDD